MSSSLKKWFLDIPWMQQSVLMSSIRNCDGVLSEGPNKILVRGIHATFIKSAQTKGSFNARRPTPEILLQAAKNFIKFHADSVPVHFYAHTMHAAEVLAYSHPSKEVRDLWYKIYELLVTSLHLRVEPEVVFCKRLADDKEQVARESAYNARCYELCDYGDGTGTVNEGEL